MLNLPPPNQRNDPPPVRRDAPNPSPAVSPRPEPAPVPVGGHPGQPGWRDAGPVTLAVEENMRRQGGLPRDLPDEERTSLLPAQGMRDCPIESCDWAGLPKDFERHFDTAHSPKQSERLQQANAARKAKRRKKRGAGSSLESDDQD